MATENNKDSLATLLEKLDLLNSKSIFFINTPKDENHTIFSLEIKKKIDIIRPDAYYVFDNKPYILFFDLTKNKDINRESEIHKKVWSFDFSPVIFIIKEDEVQVFNAFNYERNKNKLQKIEVSEKEVNKQFSFWNLQSGETWNWLQEKYYKNNNNKNRVNQKLFENIKNVRTLLTDQLKSDYLTEENSNILILRLIFIRYLIDRDVKMDEKFISGTSIKDKRESFIELIKHPVKLNEFFIQLNNKFNGVLFKDTILQLSNHQAITLSLIFNGKNDSPEYPLFRDFYFDVFDFSIIPVEVISGIYEALITEEIRNQDSAVYTPSFIVDYILSNTIDVFLDNADKSTCKVLDSSCGSGIFLVQSFRRMADKENLICRGKITKNKLKEIAENNIFGIDLNLQALKVTCFSIYIAILDYQDPKTILDDFHFPKLIDENLFQGNFFDEEHVFNTTIQNINLDFILGNPPWKSSKDKIHLDWIKRNNIVIGNNEIAQSFLLRSKDFMNHSTTTALIVSSTVFYNVSDTTKEFKTKFLTEFCVERFFDLSPVRRLIFKEKDSPAAIIQYKLSKENNHGNNLVNYSSLKSNIFLKHFRSLVVEKFDQKQIQQKLFIDNNWMFKVALYGGALDVLLLKKLINKNLTIDEIINKNDSLIKGCGIKEKPIKKTFPRLQGRSLIQNKSIQQYFTPKDRGNIMTSEDIHLSNSGNLNLYEGSQVLLKAQTEFESNIIVSFTDTSYVFKHDVFGVATKSDTDTLLILYCLFLSKINIYYQFLTSCSWGIATRPAIRLKEYFSLPFPNLSNEAKEKLVLLAKELIDISNQNTHSFNTIILEKQLESINKINAIIFDAFNIKGHELDMIDYVLDVSRYQFQESKQKNITKKLTKNSRELTEYIKIFINELSKTYKDEYIQAEVYQLNYFIAINFVFSKQPFSDGAIVFKNKGLEKEVLNAIANKLTISSITNSTDSSNNIFIQKDVKGFENNSFYVIKPNEFKCWHKAIAWYDFREIIEIIEQAELNYITINSNQ